MAISGCISAVERDVAEEQGFWDLRVPLKYEMLPRGGEGGKKNVFGLADVEIAGYRVVGR
jgi:hypothetical protein